LQTWRVAWRTKVGGAPPLEHASRESAEAYVDGLRERYRSGATRVRLVRLYDPDGGVRLVDFGAELKDSSRALRDLQRATAAKDRAVGEAITQWEVAIRRAVELGQPVEDVAAVAGLTVREVPAVLRRN
jgi:hypothetical protein